MTLSLWCHRYGRIDFEFINCGPMLRVIYDMNRRKLNTEYKIMVKAFEKISIEVCFWPGGGQSDGERIWGGGG